MSLSSYIGDLLDRRFFKQVRRKHYTDKVTALFSRFGQLLERRLKSSAGPIAANSYSLGFSAGRVCGCRVPFTEIYWEARLGFVLQTGSEGPAIACIGFEMHELSLAVVQLQGVRGRKDDLRPLRWELLLLDLVIEYARLHGVREVQVLPARRCAYNPLYNGELAQMKDYTYEQCVEWDRRLYIIYDKTAQKRGFTYDEKRRAYVLELPETAS